MSKPKLYASFDIEADGSSPANNSMLSNGIVFFNSNGTEIKSFQRNIKPLPDKTQEKRCMTEFWDKFPDVWKFVNSNQITAIEFCQELETILLELEKTYQIIWVASPAAYDWQWLNSYYDKFKSQNAPNIGFSAKCVSTLFWTYCRLNKINAKEDQEKLRETLSEGFKHTHNPEDDAREQGKMFINLCKLMNIPL